MGGILHNQLPRYMVLREPVESLTAVRMIHQSQLIQFTMELIYIYNECHLTKQNIFIITKMETLGNTKGQSSNL